MFTIQELLELWANDGKRREFIQNYKDWGIWFIQSELGLTYYKYDLPGGGRIIAMEYLREPDYYERQKGNTEPVSREKFFLQTEELFDPSFVSESTIAAKLKDIKEDLRQKNRKCPKCGGGSFQHKQDGSVLCSVCTAVVTKPTISNDGNDEPDADFTDVPPTPPNEGSGQSTNIGARMIGMMVGTYEGTRRSA